MASKTAAKEKSKAKAAEKPIKIQSINDEMGKEQRDAAAAEAERELDGLDEKAVTLVREWATKHRPACGYKRIGKLMCGVNFTDRV